LRFGSVGNDVVSLQQLLRELGYFVYPENTGYFGPITLRAVSEFQAAQKLLVTGIVNSRTAQRLNRCDERCIRPSEQGDNR
jgi:peptidoglycan hydrolase-like protein with peptidoglycan-binding domain